MFGFCMGASCLGAFWQEANIAKEVARIEVVVCIVLNFQDCYLHLVGFLNFYKYSCSLQPFLNYASQ